MLQVGEQITIRIESLAQSGAGVGFYEADTKRAVFVPYTAPGDLVCVKITKQEKVYYEAELVDVFEESKSRRKPNCKHFEKCGACDWLHIQYDEQIKQKEAILRYIFERRNIPIPSLKIIPAENEFHYRCKVRFTDGGFLTKKSHKTIDIEECALLDKKFDEILKESNKANEIYAIDESKNEVTQQEARYLVDGKELRYNPQGFVQSNFAMNRKLVSYVTEQVSGGQVLELYAGNGNFSFSLAQKSTSLVAVEGAKDSFFLLKKNIADHKVQNITACYQDVKEFVWHDKELYSTIVLDPPRVGMGRDIKNIVEQTHKIVYISCDPTALVKDIKVLHKHGFTVKSVALFDMFPQTRHFETVVVFEK